VAAEDATCEVVASTVGGTTMSDGERAAAKHNLEGGPSVLFDAVAILVSAEGAALLSDHPAARQFVADAFTHAKFIGYVAAASPLLEKAGISESLDSACLLLESASDAEEFVEQCGELRYWEREATR
jgi:catalase